MKKIVLILFSSFLFASALYPDALNNPHKCSFPVDKVTPALCSMNPDGITGNALVCPGVGFNITANGVFHKGSTTTTFKACSCGETKAPLLEEHDVPAGKPSWTWAVTGLAVNTDTGNGRNAVFTASELGSGT
ncbi:MAG: hypothetical protein WAX69_05535, partial [Victivallales bacterium]